LTRGFTVEEDRHKVISGLIEVNPLFDSGRHGLIPPDLVGLTQRRLDFGAGHSSD
tara:strand:+ start:656 stop:820 length:165 start_codon:yes stop_codon:yes gene_type:complete